MQPLNQLFDLGSRVFIVTGGAGLLGRQHAEAILEANGRVALLDVDEGRLTSTSNELAKTFGPKNIFFLKVDISNEEQLLDSKAKILDRFDRIDGLVNNAALNPKVSDQGLKNSGRFEDFNIEFWNLEVGVGLTGAMLCSKVFGSHMAKSGGGVILNISSDLAEIGPNQSIYRKTDVSEENQPKKPVSYSVIKAGLNGLTRYLATYWAEKGVRVNSLCPGGMFVDQPESFVRQLKELIPMGRMAKTGEYKGTIVYLLSDASSYMTGATVMVDGGRTCW